MVEEGGDDWEVGVDERWEGLKGVVPVRPSWPRLNHSNRSGSLVSVLAVPRGLKLCIMCERAGT